MLFALLLFFLTQKYVFICSYFRLFLHVYYFGRFMLYFYFCFCLIVASVYPLFCCRLFSHVFLLRQTKYILFTLLVIEQFRKLPYTSSSSERGEYKKRQKYTCSMLQLQQKNIDAYRHHIRYNTRSFWYRFFLFLLSRFSGISEFGLMPLLSRKMPLFARHNEFWTGL